MSRRRRIIWPALLAIVATAVLSATALTRAPAGVAETVPAPTSVTVSARSTAAVITWLGAAERYLVEITTGLDFTAARSIGVEDHLIVVDDLVPRTAYVARVTAIGDAGRSPASEPVWFTTPEPPLPERSPDVTLESTTSTTVTARWEEVSDDARYLVELAKDSTFADPASRVVTEPATTFTKLSQARTYYVRARVVDAADQVLSDWSDTVSARPLASAPLTVGTYNILKAREKAWSARKPALVRTILNEDPDVVGLQEATPARAGTGTGRRQYDDLTQALGSDWTLVDGRSGSTGETRTIYNRTRLELVSQGYDPINGSKRWGGFQRYITWAVFSQRSTGKKFLFVNTHFSPRLSRKSDGHRAAAARQLVATVKRVNDTDLPVVIVGDFNTGQNRVSSNRVYRAIVGGGYRDPLAGSSKRLGHAEKTFRAQVKTVNRYRRVAPRDAFAPLVDHIFVSPMRVLEWEVVAKLDSSGRFIGTIPSDHNMIRATVELP